MLYRGKCVVISHSRIHLKSIQILKEVRFFTQSRAVLKIDDRQTFVIPEDLRNIIFQKDLVLKNDLNGNHVTRFLGKILCCFSG